MDPQRNEPLNPPRTFRDFQREHFRDIRRMYPNYRSAEVKPSGQHRAVHGSASKPSTVSGKYGATQPVNGAINDNYKATLPVDGASRATPSVNTTGRATPVNVASRATPVNVASRATPVNVASRATPVNVASRATPVNVASRATPVNVASRATPVNVASRVTPVNVASRATPSVNTTSRATPVNVASRATPSVNTTSRATPVNGAGSATPVNDAVTAPQATAATGGNPITSTSVPLHSGTISGGAPSAKSAPCHPAHANASSIRQDTHSKSQTAPETWRSLTAGSTLNTKVTSVEAPNSDGPKKIRRRRIKKHRVSKVVVDKKRCGNRGEKLPTDDGPKALDCSVYDEVSRLKVNAAAGQGTTMAGPSSVSSVTAGLPSKAPGMAGSSVTAPDMTWSSVTAPGTAWSSVTAPGMAWSSVTAPLVAKLLGSSTITKKKKKWTKFKEKVKARRLTEQETRLQSSSTRNCEEVCSGSNRGTLSEIQQQTQPSGCVEVDECGLSPKDTASRPTKKVSFALESSDCNSLSSTSKDGRGFGSPAASQNSAPANRIVTNTPPTIGPQVPSSSNGTILLNCSSNVLEELCPEELVTPQPNLISVSSQRKSSIQQRASCSLINPSPLRNSLLSLMPSSSLPLLTNNPQGLHSKTRVSKLSRAHRSPVALAHQAIIPTVMYPASDSSDHDSLGPLATSSQVLRPTSLKRKVATVEFVSSKKINLTSSGEVLELNKCSLFTSSNKESTASQDCVIQKKKVRFSNTPFPDSSVSVVIPSEISSALSSSSGPSVISATPSPEDTSKKRVQFMSSVSPLRVISKPSKGREGTTSKNLVIVNEGVLVTQTNNYPVSKMGQYCRTTPDVASQPNNQSPTFAEDSVVIISPEQRPDVASQPMNQPPTFAEDSVVIISPEQRPNVASQPMNQPPTFAEDSVVIISPEQRPDVASRPNNQPPTFAEDSVVIISPEQRPDLTSSQTEIEVTHMCSEKTLLCDDNNNSSDESHEKLASKEGNVSCGEEAIPNSAELSTSEEFGQSIISQNNASQSVSNSEILSSVKPCLFRVPHEYKGRCVGKCFHLYCGQAKLENSMDFAL